MSTNIRESVSLYYGRHLCSFWCGRDFMAGEQMNKLWPEFRGFFVDRWK